MLKRVIRISIYSIIGAIALVALSMVLLYHHTPGWYRPPRFTDEQLDKTSGQMSNHLLGKDAELMTGPPGVPVHFELTQDQANRYLQSVMHNDERARRPDWLSDPMIVFQPGRMIFAARIRQLGNRPVSLHLKLAIDGDKVAVAIESVNVGSLPLPQQMVQDQLGELAQKVRSAGQSGGAGPSGRVKDKLLKIAQDFIGAVQGEPMPREYATIQTNRPFRVEKLELVEGKLLLTFVPRGEPAPGYEIPEFEE